jgi:hypothetical protein
MLNPTNINIISNLFLCFQKQIKISAMKEFKEQFQRKNTGNQVLLAHISGMKRTS